MLWLDAEGALQVGTLGADQQPGLERALIFPVQDVIPLGEQILATPAGMLVAWRSPLGGRI